MSCFYVIFLNINQAPIGACSESMSDRAQQRRGPQWDALEVIIQV